MRDPVYWTVVKVSIGDPGAHNKTTRTSATTVRVVTPIWMYGNHNVTCTQRELVKSCVRLQIPPRACRKLSQITQLSRTRLIQLAGLLFNVLHAEKINNVKCRIAIYPVLLIR